MIFANCCLIDHNHVLLVKTNIFIIFIHKWLAENIFKKIQIINSLLRNVLIVNDIVDCDFLLFDQGIGMNNYLCEN